MSDTYLPTADDGEVIKRTDATITLQQLIDTYVSLKNEWDNRPTRKTVPDIEAMDMWNGEFDREDATIRNNIKVGAYSLYLKIKPIYEGGLLPARYTDEYLKLETFANS